MWRGEHISTKIKLFIEQGYDPFLESKIKNYLITRLFCLVKFKMKNGEWSKAYPALVDTGAYTSVIPASKWKDFKLETITTHEMRGIVAKKECYVPVIIGKVKISITDGIKETKELETHAFCALTDSVPLILGVKDLLDRLKLTVDIKNREGFVEE